MRRRNTSRHQGGSEVVKKGLVLSLFALALCVGVAVTAGAASPADAAARAVKPSCRVPAVVGRTLVVAKARIRKAHCRVGRVRYVRSTARQKNRVVSQRPKRGRKLKKGARVNLTVGRGPATVSNLYRLYRLYRLHRRLRRRLLRPLHPRLQQRS